MGRYTLRIIDTFSSAHSLRGYEGNCERMHGHNWKVEVEVGADTLDERGIAIDFRELKRILKEVMGELDHRNLNELQPFSSVNPSSENIAKYIFSRMEKGLPSHVELLRVTVWESESAAASYERS